MGSVSVFRKGETVTLNTNFTVEKAYDFLSQSNLGAGFVADLLSAYRRKKITAKQEAWLVFLAEEKLQASQKAPVIGEFAILVNAIQQLQSKANMSAAQRGRNAAKVTLRFVGATVSAVTSGQNEGSAYVKTDGNYMGKITPDGVFAPAYGIEADFVIECLRAVAKDPTGAAIAYGRETGTCSCCGRKLTKEDSIQLGIGPICLEKLGGAI